LKQYISAHLQSTAYIIYVIIHECTHNITLGQSKVNGLVDKEDENLKW